MTTQRDRLAAILTEGLADLDTPQDFGDFAPVCTPREYADALIARGVRVVDVETLAAALDEICGASFVPVEAASPTYEWLDADGTAVALLSALDGGNRAENSTETTPESSEPRVGVYDRDAMANIMNSLKR